VSGYGRGVPSPEPAVDVVDVPDRERYEIHREGQTLGFSAYQKANGLIVFTHTEVDPGLEGQGIGSALVRAALDDVRRQGVPVLPICPFVAQWIARHPDYHDLDYRRPASRVTD
jgi:uncharacterized protein